MPHLLQGIRQLLSLRLQLSQSQLLNPQVTKRKLLWPKKRQRRPRLPNPLRLLKPPSQPPNQLQLKFLLLWRKRPKLFR